MEQLGTVFTMLLIVWGVVTAVLAVLVIYRATLSSHEDDQIFITAGEHQQYHEQEAIIAKITQLSRPIIALTALWSVLLLGVAGVWLYRGFKSF